MRTTGASTRPSAVAGLRHGYDWRNAQRVVEADMSDPGPAVLRGEARRPGGSSEPAMVQLGADGLTVAVGSGVPWSAAYRDMSVVAVDAAAALVVLGDGPGADRWLFERFGEHLGALVRGLRDGRLRQWLSDGLVDDAAEPAIDLVEYAFGEESGVGQLLYHRRGVVVAPLDERRPRRRIRRADIGDVVVEAATGAVRVGGAGGRPLARASTAAYAQQDDDLVLPRLGTVARAHGERWSGLRDGASSDAAAVVAGLIPDAPYDVRRVAGRLMLEGRPVGPSDLGPGWSTIESAVLVDPVFAESYRALVELGGGDSASRWLVAAPREPGVPEDPILWSFVGLPGDLVAMELVSGGAHATYLFRVVPRATDTGALPEGAFAAAVAEVSEALIDARFLREPMALSAARLTEPAYLRYRLALAVLPSLAAARRRFVARIVHRDAATWRAAIEDLIAWHGSSKDDGAEWPGRAEQERMVEEAAEGG